jgi:hypothetical protein
MLLLPPDPNVCQQCAVVHEKGQPHNQESLHWQYYFYFENGRWPTWDDALAHCSEQVKLIWWNELNRYGITPQRPETPVRDETQDTLK